MTAKQGEALSRILSGRAAALGFANAAEAGASGILDRVRRGACLACSVSVPVGEAFPPAVCGCEAPSRRAEMAVGHAGYIASRILGGWCSEHATTVAKGQHRPNGCAACRAGLPDWAALLAQAQAADFFERHKIGAPLPLVPRLRGAQQGAPVNRQSDNPAPRGGAVLGAASPDLALLSVADLRAEIERQRAERAECEMRLSLRRHRLSYAEYEAERRRSFALFGSISALEKRLEKVVFAQRRLAVHRRRP